jgi:hypothetical protein
MTALAIGEWFNTDNENRVCSHVRTQKIYCNNSANATGTRAENNLNTLKQQYYFTNEIKLRFEQKSRTISIVSNQIITSIN